MDDMRLYGELSHFLNSGLWRDVLRPKMEDWAAAKAGAMNGAKTQQELWDARTAANTAKEALSLLDDALGSLRAKLKDQVTPPPTAMT